MKKILTAIVLLVFSVVADRVEAQEIHKAYLLPEEVFNLEVPEAQLSNTNVEDTKEEEVDSGIVIFYRQGEKVEVNVNRQASQEEPETVEVQEVIEEEIHAAAEEEVIPGLEEAMAEAEKAEDVTDTESEVGILEQLEAAEAEAEAEAQEEETEEKEPVEEQKTVRKKSSGFFGAGLGTIMVGIATVIGGAVAFFVLRKPKTKVPSAPEQQPMQQGASQQEQPTKLQDAIAEMKEDAQEEGAPPPEEKMP